MRQYNFNAPQYTSFGQRQDQYIEGLKQGAGTLARTPVNAYNAWKTDEDNKRKWDNMLEQQKYQRERDSIADERYSVEQRRIEDELRRKNERERAAYEAMAMNKAFMRQRYGVGDWESQDRDLEDIDRSMEDIENGGFDNYASIQYGRAVNGAKTRARNLVANDGDYEMMKATPSDFVGNGRFAQPSPNGNPYASLEKYGEGAVMAAAMMENASNPEDYNAAYNYLMSTIIQHDQAEQGRQEIERERAVARADDQLSSNIVLHPVMSEVSRIAAGAPLKNYTAADVNGMISTLQDLERQAMTIGDNSKRMEVMAKINNAYGKLEEIYGRKTAPGARRK